MKQGSRSGCFTVMFFAIASAFFAFSPAASEAATPAASVAAPSNVRWNLMSFALSSNPDSRIRRPDPRLAGTVSFDFQPLDPFLKARTSNCDLYLEQKRSEGWTIRREARPSICDRDLRMNHYSWATNILLSTRPGLSISSRGLPILPQETQSRSVQVSWSHRFHHYRVDIPPVGENRPLLPPDELVDEVYIGPWNFQESSTERAGVIIAVSQDRSYTATFDVLEALQSLAARGNLNARAILDNWRRNGVVF